nr:uncharacterized protein LOC112204552 [Pan troglodytes]
MFRSRSLGLSLFFLTLTPGRGVCVSLGTAAQINKHCSCGASSSPARPSVRPPPPPPSFHPRPRAPSKPHYLASALRASGPGNNFPKNRKRKARGARTPAHPGAETASAPGGGSVCGASRSLSPGRQPRAQPQPRIQPRYLQSLCNLPQCTSHKGGLEPRAGDPATTLTPSAADLAGDVPAPPSPSAIIGSFLRPSSEADAGTMLLVQSAEL